MNEEELLNLLEEEKQKGNKSSTQRPTSSRSTSSNNMENLEKIGSSVLSGLASITSMSADALSELAENRSKNNATRSEIQKREIEIRKKQASLAKAKREIERKKKKEKSKIKSISFIVAMFFLLLFSTLLGATNFDWIGIFAAIAAYHGTKAILPRILKSNNNSEVPLNARRDGENIELPRSEEDLFLEIIDKVNYRLDTIYNNMRRTRDEEIKVLMGNVYERGIEITEYLKNYPQKITISRRFLNYYLDTASKISKNYVDFETKSLRQNREHIKEETKKALIMLETAFDKEFYKLVENDLVDFEADIKVLEESMKWDNYTK